MAVIVSNRGASLRTDVLEQQRQADLRQSLKGHQASTIKGETVRQNRNRDRRGMDGMLSPFHDQFVVICCRIEIRKRSRSPPGSVRWGVLVADCVAFPIRQVLMTLAEWAL